MDAKPAKASTTEEQRQRPPWYVTVGVVIVVGATMAGMAWMTWGAYQRSVNRALALVALKDNPEVEVLQEDQLTNEVTIRTKNGAGGELTLAYDAASKGFKVKSATVKGQAGEKVAVLGASTAPPAWVLRYPGLGGKSGAVRSDKAGKASGFVSGETADPVSKVKTFYDSQLKAAGFAREQGSWAKDTPDEAVFSVAKDGTYKMSLIITAQAGKTQILVNYEGPGS